MLVTGLLTRIECCWLQVLFFFLVLGVCLMTNGNWSEFSSPLPGAGPLQIIIKFLLDENMVLLNELVAAKGPFTGHTRILVRRVSWVVWWQKGSEWRESLWSCKPSKNRWRNLCVGKSLDDEIAQHCENNKDYSNWPSSCFGCSGQVGWHYSWYKNLTSIHESHALIFRLVTS